MSLKDLLPPDTYDKIMGQAQSQKLQSAKSRDLVITKTQATAPKDPNTVMVHCPICRKLIPYTSSNPFRPFCSERCKLIDLGAWAKEERTILSDDLDDDES